MDKPTVCVHTLVKNEENFLWYGVSSVINYVDKVLLWDTGSTDKTVQLIKKLAEEWPEKIGFKELGEVDSSTLVAARQKMLAETKTDWIMVLDGDEVWWDEGIKNVLSEISLMHPDVGGLAVPFYNCVGDIFHYQEESAGRYSLAGKKGHVSLRFLRNVGGLKVRGTYPYEFYTADNKRPIQEVRKIEFTDIPYLHLTHLSRSSQDAKIKEKAEIGISFPLDFYYPEVFFGEKPNLVPSPWKRLGGRNLIKAALATPPRKIKRRIF